MDGSVFVSQDGTSFVNRFSNNINDSSEGFWADWNENGGAGIRDWLTTNETFSGVEGDGSDVVTTQMLGDFQNEPVWSSLYFESVQNGGKLSFKLHVDDGTNNLRNLSVCLDGGGEATYTTEYRQLHSKLLVEVKAKTYG